MNKIKQYENWQEFSPQKTKLPCTWTDKDLEFDWVETIQTDEVPKNDVWESYTTTQKYFLAELHKNWGVPDESTVHYMSFNPQLTEEFASIIEPFKQYNYSCNLLKLTPGHMLVWHFDTYATFVKRKDIQQESADNIKRSAVMMTDWDCGQVLQVGNEVLSHWKKGDVFTWFSYTWHGTCNFGKSDMILAQVSYLCEDKI